MRHEADSGRAALGPRVGIVDYGGSARSVEHAFERIGASPVRTLDRDTIFGLDGIVLPGGMSFPTAMQRIRDAELVGAFESACKAQTPVLGIGVGMQLLFDRSLEEGGCHGLGLLAGEVEAMVPTAEHKVPHTAWKPVEWTRQSPLNEGLPDPCSFYHMHSFVVVPEEPDDVIGMTEHGDEFVSAVQRGATYGVQFHPEKSRGDGLHLLRNYAAECARAAGLDPWT